MSEDEKDTRKVNARHLPVLYRESGDSSKGKSDEFISIRQGAVGQVVGLGRNGGMLVAGSSKYAVSLEGIGRVMVELMEEREWHEAEARKLFQERVRVGERLREVERTLQQLLALSGVVMTKYRHTVRGELAIGLSLLFAMAAAIAHAYLGR